MKNSYFYQNFIFDLDGTLVDSIGDIADAVNHAFSVFGLPARELIEFPSFIGDGSVILLKRALKDIKLSDEQFHALFDVYYHYYMQHFVVKTRAYSGIQEALLTAKENGIRLFVYSNKPDEIAKIVIEHCFIKNLFERVVGIPLNSRVKPDPDPFLTATIGYDIDYTRTAYFGDSGTDILTAKNLGIENIFSVLWGYKDINFFNEFALKPKRFITETSEIQKIANRLL